jgi:hypothetical protein
MPQPGRHIYDVEMIEAIDRDERTRDVVLRMADLARNDKLDAFVKVVHTDPELDDDTRRWVLLLARSESFLLAASLYLERSRDVS